MGRVHCACAKAGNREATQTRDVMSIKSNTNALTRISSMVRNSRYACCCSWVIYNAKTNMKINSSPAQNSHSWPYRHPPHKAPATGAAAASVTPPHLWFCSQASQNRHGERSNSHNFTRPIQTHRRKSTGCSLCISSLARSSAKHMACKLLSKPAAVRMGTA